jgi:hypothetical protein
MPRAGAYQSKYNRDYEAKLESGGYKRGPWLTGAAHERLRELCFVHRLTRTEVVSRLLLGIPLDHGPPAPRYSDQQIRSFAAEFRVTDVEAARILGEPEPGHG